MKKFDRVGSMEKDNTDDHNDTYNDTDDNKQGSDSNSKSKNTTLSIKASSIHSFISSKSIKKNYKKLKNLPDVYIQESLQLRLLLTELMNVVIEHLTSEDVVCLDDLKDYFDIHLINMKSDNGEAYWLHLGSGEFRKIRILVKATQPVSKSVDSSALPFHSINELVTQYSLPHLPLFYGEVTCPKERCRYSSAEIQRKLKGDRYGCTIQFLEYFNGGTMGTFIDKEFDAYETKTGTELMKNMLLQIFFGIYGIHKYLNVTHNDTHLHNVMLARKYGKDHRLKIKTKKYYIYKLDDYTLYVPYYDFSIYLIDFDFLGDFDNVSEMYVLDRKTEEKRPMFKLDYYRTVENLLLILRQNHFKVTEGPKLTEFFYSRLMPIQHLKPYSFYMKDSFQAKFKYVDVQWGRDLILDFVEAFLPDYFRKPTGEEIIILNENSPYLY